MENSWTSTLYVSYDSSIFWRLLDAPYFRRVVETKSRQNRTFDQAVREVNSVPARFWDRDARWFVMRLYVLEQPGDELQHFFGGDSLPL